MDNAFGEKLRKCRLAAGFGLRELARRCGKSAGYLSDVEQGHVAPPSELTIVTIAAALGVERKDLLAAAKKVDPELSSYVAQKPEAADFLRLARERGFEEEDWARIGRLARKAGLGKSKRGPQ